MNILAGSSTPFHHDQQLRWRDHPGTTSEPAPAAMPAAPTAPASAAAVAGPVALLDYRMSDRTSITIRTQEGDLVRIRIRSSQTLSAESATASNGGQLLAQLTFGSSRSESLRLTVEGNLNADELKAIQEVVNQAGALANQFFSGDLSAAFAAASQLHIDGSQLANVGLSFSARERLTYAASQAAAAPSDTATAPASPAAAPGGNAPANTTLADTLGKIAGFLGQLMQMLSSTPAGSGAATGGSDTNGSAASPRSSAPGLQLSLSLKIRIFQSVLINAAQLTARPADAQSPAASQSSLPDLVPKTLDALAARHAAPVELQA